jgi:hypothetical protein
VGGTDVGVGVARALVSRVASVMSESPQAAMINVNAALSRISDVYFPPL